MEFSSALLCKHSGAVSYLMQRSNRFYHLTALLGMNWSEEKFVHLMAMVKSVRFEATHNPKTAFFCFRKRVKSTGHYHKIIAMINDFYAGFGTSLAAMNHFCAQQFAEL
jgi:hypothetical protein